MSEEPLSIKQLKRIAFGRDATPAERAAAGESLRRREEQELAAAADAEREFNSLQLDEGVDDGDEAPEPAGDDEADADEQRGEQSLWRRSIRVGWLVPVVVGSLLLGAVGAMNATGQFEPVAGTATPTPTSEPWDYSVEELRSGDLIAADAWFDLPFLASDAFPDVDMLKDFGIEEPDVRLAVDGGDLGKVWVGRADDKLCLVITQPDLSGAASCNERDQFRLQGMYLSTGDFSANWFGASVETNPPVDTRVEIPPFEVPAPIPGDVAAADTWFEMPLTKEDKFPALWMLESLGVNQNDVRLLGSDEEGHKVFAVNLRGKGFCLVSYDIRAGFGQNHCATPHAFKESGLSLMTAHFVASWNGATFVMQGEQ